MIATGWSNGAPKETGAGYGLRIRLQDRGRYFDQAWSSVIVELPEGEWVTIPLSDSFWRKCAELRSSQVGKWMLDRGFAPWPKGNPLKFALEPLCNGRFTLRVL